MGARLVVNPTDEVDYSGSATKADAEALGADLKRLELSGEGRELSVGLRKDKSGAVVSFVAGEVGLRPEAVGGFVAMGQEFAEGSVGRPLTLHLCDRDT